MVLFVLLSLMLQGVNAMLPMMVYGKVTFGGVVYTNHAVTITDTDLGASWVIKTNSNGIYQVTLNNFYDDIGRPIESGHTIVITACPVEINPDCSVTVTASTTPQKNDFTIDGYTPPPQEYVCWDGSIVSDPNDCPEIPVPDPEYTCWDDSVVSDPADCPIVPDPDPEPDYDVPATIDLTQEVETRIIDGKIIAYYGQEICVEAGHNRIPKLIDETIEFNGEDIDVKEEVYLCGDTVVKTSIDDTDYTEPMLVLYEGNFVYKYVFKEQVDLTDIDEGETLEITVLGVDYEIISADHDSITMIVSGKKSYDEGEEVTLDTGEVFTIDTVSDGGVRITYDGETIVINEDEIEQISDREFYVTDILVDEDGVDSVSITVGKDIKRTIDSGDEYSKDNDDFVWDISMAEGSAQYIGVINQHDYVYVDDSDGHKPLKVGDRITLPNDYLSLAFEGITTPTIKDLTFRVRDNRLEVKGGDDSTFVKGTSTYDDIYITDTGIYDDDDVLIDVDRVRIGDSEIYLEKGSALLKYLYIVSDMSDIYYNGVSYANKDDRYLDWFGLEFNDVEGAVQDGRGFRVDVPEDRPEVTITLSDKDYVAPHVTDDDDDEDTVTDDEPTDTTTDDDVIVIDNDEGVFLPLPCSDEPPITTCEVCEPCDPTVDEDCPEVPVDGKGLGFWGILSYILVGLGGLGIGGKYIKKAESEWHGGGLKTYEKRDGTIAIDHKHHGLRGYHDPMTSHREKHEKHPRGEMTPKYEKDDTDTWVYVDTGFKEQG